MDTEVGLRERKKQATRRDLRSAALRLVDERGLDRVTVEDIAEAAGVSGRTFFNYFACKEDAIVGTAPEREAELREALARRPLGEPPLESLRHVMRDVAADYAHRADEVTVRMRVVRENPALLPRHLAVFGSFQALLQEAVAARTGPRDGADHGADEGDAMYPALAAGAAATALRVAIEHWMENQRSHDLLAAIDDAFAALGAGLPPPASIRPDTPPADATPPAHTPPADAIPRRDA